MQGQPASADTKTCPMCAEDIKAAAVICRFCGHRFDAEDASETLPPKPNGPPPDVLTKQLRPYEELFVWSEGYLWAASGCVAITSDRILFVGLGGNVEDHPLAVDRKVTVAGQRVDVEVGGGLWRFQGLHPDIAREIGATVVPGLAEKLFANDSDMQDQLRLRHERIARAPSLAPRVSVTVKHCKYLGGISALGSASSLPWNIQFNPRDIQLRSVGQTRFTISEPKSGGVAVEGHEQLQQRLSATRVAALGIFALAAPKKMRRATSYITLSVVGGETGIFEVRDAEPMKVRASLSPWLAEH